jgi:hypothetical protein
VEQTDYCTTNVRVLPTLCRPIVCFCSPQADELLGLIFAVPKKLRLPIGRIPEVLQIANECGGEMALGLFKSIRRHVGAK